MLGSQCCAADDRYALPADLRGYLIAGLSFASGLALGAISMYMCDPDRGKARRARLQAEALNRAAQGHSFMKQNAGAMLVKAKRGISKAGEMLTRGEAEADAVLARVRTHLAPLA